MKSKFTILFLSLFLMADSVFGLRLGLLPKGTQLMPPEGGLVIPQNIQALCFIPEQTGGYQLEYSETENCEHFGKRNQRCQLVLKKPNLLGVTVLKEDIVLGKPQCVGQLFKHMPPGDYVCKFDFEPSSLFSQLHCRSAFIVKSPMPMVPAMKYYKKTLTDADLVEMLEPGFKVRLPADDSKDAPVNCANYCRYKCLSSGMACYLQCIKLQCR